MRDLIMKHPMVFGIIGGNQFIVICVLIYNLFVYDFITAFATYGFTTLIIICPTLLISLIYNLLKNRSQNEI